MPNDTKSVVLPKLADHNAVLSSFNLHTPQKHDVDRVVWSYKDADWTGLHNAIFETDWKGVLSKTDVNSEAKTFTESILALIKDFIPTRVVKDVKSTHP